MQFIGDSSERGTGAAARVVANLDLRQPVALAGIGARRR